jgi:hypothetical protein
MPDTPPSRESPLLDDPWCADGLHPAHQGRALTLEDVSRLVARLREHGVKVINPKGEDLRLFEIEALLKDLNQ